MKILNSEVLLLKNKPLLSDELESVSQAQAKKADEYSIFIRITGEYESKILVGLGEARPSVASEESLKSSMRYARKMVRHLVGQQVDLNSGKPTQHVHDMVSEISSFILGVSNDFTNQRRPSPSVCFAIECALLDLIAKKQSVSVKQLTCSDTAKGVKRNVFNEPLKKPEQLLQSIANGKNISGWLRRGKRIESSEASGLVNSLLFALSEHSHDLKGIILNAGQRWSIDDWNNFCNEIVLTGLAAKQNVTIIVEDPFREDADAFYQQAFTKMEGTPLRIMLAKPVWGQKSINHLAPYLPFIDLKIMPQKAGSYHEVLEAEKEAHQLGFKGHIFLSGVSSTTNMNTIAMVSLASAMQTTCYFSTSFKKERKTRLVYPCVTLQNNDLLLPEGPGFATNLCRSGLRRRLVALHAYDEHGRIDKRTARKALLESVYDDRFIDREIAEQKRYNYCDSELESTLKPTH